MLIASLDLIVLCALIQHWIVAVFIRSTASSVLLSLHVINPIFFFNFYCVNFFTGIVFQKKKWTKSGWLVVLGLLGAHRLEKKKNTKMVTFQEGEETRSVRS